MLEEVIARGPFREFEVLDYRCTIEFIRAEIGDKRYNRETDQLFFWVKFNPEVCSIISTGVALPLRDYDEKSLIQALGAVIEDRIYRIQKEYEIKAIQEVLLDSRREKLNALVSRISTLLAVKK
jgi:hypothetical protein